MERDDDFGIRRDSDGWADFDRGFPNIPIADYRGAVVLREPQGEPQGPGSRGDSTHWRRSAVLHDVPNRAERAETPVVPVVEEVHLERTRVDRFPDTAQRAWTSMCRSPPPTPRTPLSTHRILLLTPQNGG